MGGRAVTARRALPPDPRRTPRRSWVLTDDGVIDPIAVEIATSGSRPVALTRAERQLAAGRILARGGTVEEAARRLRLGRTLVYRLISSGQLESVKVGRLRRVPAECLPEYVTALRGTRSPEAADGSSAA